VRRTQSSGLSGHFLAKRHTEKTKNVDWISIVKHLASAEAVANAPMDVVWSVLRNIADSSRWNPDGSFVDLRGPLAPSTELRWKSRGALIVSKRKETEPKRRIAWTGRTSGASLDDASREVGDSRVMPAISSLRVIRPEGAGKLPARRLLAHSFSDPLQITGVRS
jgi:hypothetical protein